MMVSHLSLSCSSVFPVPIKILQVLNKCLREGTITYTNETYTVTTWHHSQRDLEITVFIQAVEGHFNQLILKSPPPLLLQTVLLIPGSFTREVPEARIGLALASLTGKQAASPVPTLPASCYSLSLPHHGQQLQPVSHAPHTPQDG